MALPMAMVASSCSCSAAPTPLFNPPLPSAATEAGGNYAARSISLPVARLQYLRKGRARGSGMDRIKSGPMPLLSLLARATTSEDTATNVSEELEVLAVGEETTTSEDTVNNVSEELEVLPVGEETPEESSSDVSQQFDDVLAYLKQKFDSLENKSTPLVYGSAALVALWVSATVVDSIDSVPLLPKVMEFIGFGYTVWFVYRYLLFKGSRDELAAAIDDLKQKITG